MYLRVCKICEKQFTSKHHSTTICSPECKKESVRINREKTSKNIKEIGRRKNKKSDTIIDIAVKAKEAGMSYGQYVARYLS